MPGRDDSPSILLLWFGGLTLACVAVGAAAGGAHAAAWTRNLAAWVLGALAAAALARAWRPSWTAPLLWLAPAALPACWLGPGQLGVHRWVGLGSLHINLAMLLLPAAVVALGARAAAGGRPWLAAIVALALLSAQPDASQATALAAGAAAVALAVIDRAAARFGAVALLFGMAAIAWLRPDPLGPVPEVEGAVGLAFARSTLLGGAALAGLAAAAAAPAVLARGGPPQARAAGLALGLCLLVWAVAPFVGAFPVPFVGVGPSPIVGAWLGAGALAGVMRRPGDQAQPSSFFL